MANLPLYSEARTMIVIPENGHRGLWYDRFYNGYEEDFNGLGNEDSKRRWITSAAKTPAGISEDIERAAAQLQSLCEKLGGKAQVFAADWHFATGLGNPHPVENGFLWHPTLGTPYINGAAVKGLVRSWVESWMVFENSQSKRDTLRRWFGSESKDPQCCTKESQAGAFIFFDALPAEPITLKADVMTPHMAKWYEKGGEDPMNPEVTPADWHNPVPVFFLVADKPKFIFAIAPRNEDAGEDLSDVLTALSSALEWLGAGAKTAAGYGRMTGLEGEAQKWLDDTIAQLGAHRDFNGQPEETLWKKALADKYRLASPDIRKEVLPLIKAKWQDLGIDWERPTGGSAQDAKRKFLEGI